MKMAQCSYEHTNQSISQSYSDSDPKIITGLVLPRFGSQILTTAARGCNNFNNLRTAAAGRVVASLEFCSGAFLLWTGNLGEQF